MGNILSKIDFVLAKIQEYICIIAGSVVCILIVVGAFTRYVLKVDFYGSEELILMTAFWLYFIGSSLAAREDSHINADMTSLFIKSEKIKDKIVLIRYILSFGISLLATYWSLNYIIWSLNLRPLTSVLKLPVTIAQFPILISFILTDIYIFGYIIKTIKKIRGGEIE